MFKSSIVTSLFAVIARSSQSERRGNPLEPAISFSVFRYSLFAKKLTQLTPRTLQQKAGCQVVLRRQWPV